MSHNPNTISLSGTESVRDLIQLLSTFDPDLEVYVTPEDTESFEEERSTVHPHCLAIEFDEDFTITRLIPEGDDL